jgi:siroheme synthase-like protein
MSQARPLLPLFVDVSGAVVVVTGSGPASREAAARLQACGATVRRVEQGGAAPDLDGALLLLCASDDPAADAPLLSAACERALLAVSVTSPAGRAFLGACEERDGLAIAATTRGRSGVLEQRLAAEAARAIEPHHARLAEILAGLRAKLEERIPDDAIRATIWEQILDSPVALLLQSGSDDEAVEMAERMAWGTG